MSRSGGLLELVARGKKDVFFTSNPAVCFFHSIYHRSAAFTKEIYVTKSRNVPEWGRYVDFDIDHRGDIIKQSFLRIQLPTWIPPALVSTNNTGIVSDLSGITYGYVNNVGYLMIDKIQLFNDNVLLCETYGTYMDWRHRQSYEFGTTFLFNEAVGGRVESAIAIERSSTSTALRVPIPILGWQTLGDPGLPIVALRGSRYRIRIHLRPYADVLVASDGRLKPNPFSMPLSAQSVKNGSVDTSQRSLTASCMKNLDISLETTYMYLPADVNTWLRASVLRFPFHHVQQQIFTIEDNIMNAAAHSATDLKFPLSLDFMGPVSRLLVGFRSEANTLSGQLNVLRPPAPGTIFVKSMRLNIANIDRVKTWDMATFREVSTYWKNRRMPLDQFNTDKPDEIYTVSFGGFDYNSPAGTLSFTRAVLPTLYLVLNSTPYDTRNISRKSYAIVYAESWNVYEIGRSTGRLLFDDS